MFNRKPSLLYLATALTLSVLVMLLAGCDSSSSSSDDEASGEVTVSITATPASITAGDYTVIEAIVQSGTTGLADQQVTFSVLPASSGSCSPEVATTDADGAAATMLTATGTGSISVTATVEGSSVTATAWVTVTEEGQTGTGNVSMTVSPSLIFATGEDTARVSIAVQDANGNPAPDNTLIKICAGEKFVDLDGNGYWSQGIDSLVFDNNSNGLWDAVGSIPSTAYTGGGNGTATVDFVSGTRAGTYYIKATVDEGGISDFAEQSVQLNPSTELHSIFLAAELMNVVVAQTGGIETADLYATGYDINGNPVPEGLVFTFMILDGPDGGEFLGDDPLVDEVEAITNSQGMATVPIHSGFVSGTVRIRAYNDTILSNATQIMVHAGPPKYIVMAVEKCNMQGWYSVDERNGVTAVVSDTFLNPVVDSTVVYFSCDEGTMIAHERRTENEEGIATSEWISNNNVPTADGEVWLWAETAGGTVLDSVAFINSSPIFTAWAVPNAFSLTADGKDYRDIMIYGEDENGHFMIPGTTVEFKGDDFVSIENAVLMDGCFTCQDEIRVKSGGLLEVDKSLTGGNDDGIGYVLPVSGYCGVTSIYMFTVTLNTGYAYVDNCEVKCETNVAVGATIPVSAVIKDRWGNPLGDHTLTLTASAGNVTNGTQETDAYGEASGFNFTAPGSAEKVTLTITDSDPRGGIYITTSVTVE